MCQIVACQNIDNDPFLHFPEAKNLAKRSQSGGCATTDFKLTSL